MSNTPLTDAAIRSILQTGPHYRVNADFARSLELDNRAMPRSIFLLVGTFDHAGDTILAVLSTRAEAEALKEWGEKNMDKHGLRRYGYDGLAVGEWKMGERDSSVPHLPPA